MTIRFLLICEGPSDRALVSHIRSLLISYGAAASDGTSSNSGNTIADKIRQGRELFGALDILFIHRDADSYRDSDAAGSEKRRAEIAEAVISSGHDGPYVGIVPVQMTETWLLVNESEIRRVAGNPRGLQDLGLPSVNRLETISNPKESLENALLVAGAPRGVRRIKNFRNDFGNFRRQLLENLPVGGPLEQVPSWVRFRDDTVAALQALSS